MKNALLIIFIVFICSSCKQEKEVTLKSKPLSVAQKIANAHGFENWKDVSKINFTFNVDKDSSHFERIWTWEPKIDRVTLSTKGDSIIVFNRKKVDSNTIKHDQAFINDKFWLLTPFQLVWDEGATVSQPTKVKAPISKDSLNKITITYSENGGYTPGDAYDIYYGTDFLIKEWVYREGNSIEPSLTNTFENYQDFNGIKIATQHKKPEGKWDLNFTDITVIIE